MREIITISAGQGGNQVAYKTWDLITKEHSINPDSGMFTGEHDSQIQKADVYFNEIPGGRFVPRSVLIDLEPGVLGQMQSCPKLGKLHNPDNFISAMNGAGNCWAKGYMTDGPEIIDQAMDQIRKQIEYCDAP